jgi:hypothetical protein
MPNIPISSPHPVGWTNPVNLRASAALAAAGAWDAAPTESFCAGAETLTLSLTYTRGAAGGAFDFQMQVSVYGVVGDAPAGADEWVTEAIYAGGAVAAGADTTSLVQRELESYTSQGAAAESFVYGPVEVKQGVQRVRIRARESGVVGTPGTLQIAGVLL